MKSRPTTLNLPCDLVAKLDLIAKDERSNRSAQATILLEKALKETQRFESSLSAEETT